MWARALHLLSVLAIPSPPPTGGDYLRVVLVCPPVGPASGDASRTGHPDDLEEAAAAVTAGKTPGELHVPNRHRGNTLFLPCGHFDFESAITAQNDVFKAVFILARIHVC